MALKGQSLGPPASVEEYLQSRAQNKADLSKFNMLLPETEAEFISITNTVDDIGCPENFTYIDKNIYSDDIPRPCTPLHFCECVGECGNNCVCVRESYYDANGKVQVDRHVPLMECGPKCKCGDNCSTRVVQWGSKTKFEIYRSLFKGWGVRAAQFIGKGTFIAEYVGEDTAAGLTYLFDLDMAYTYGASADFSIDAKTYGNISHFFNHSCDPNMEIRQVFIEHRDPRLHRLAFFSTRDIDSGEELTFGYSPSASDEGTVSFDCYCGSNICRGRINF
ncbi:hypothetical protein BX661DRAFT_197728 [Kickxella alabastrina]|uniref:uncharacterized protein n=1 Tax=Kickxella alabastrina TaxID=61397 RepID=UPI002220B8E2|nr:uncharacterized protein BX661DRAFT_197728 [Kickxella alabastrina]KAI7830023.1 hypothetical protein BX661DRAFT_197728 [Kickxella alabastrina]